MCIDGTYRFSPNLFGCNFEDATFEQRVDWLRRDEEYFWDEDLEDDYCRFLDF